MVVVRPVFLILRIRASATLLLTLSLPCLEAQAPQLSRPFPTAETERLYAELLPEIRKIAVFDNHSHPGFADDPDVDAQAAPPGMTLALRLRDNNPELIAAARALFDYPYTDGSPEHQKWLVEHKAAARKKHADMSYFNRILDAVNIETAMANRVAMPDYLDPQRFKWVFFVDSFLFPFQYDCFYADYPDDRTYLPLQDKKLHREMAEVGVRELPADLAGYLRLMTRIIELHKRNGGVAIKFEAAYFRPLKFGDPSRSEAAAIYKKFRGGTRPDYESYLVLQDYIFRRILEQAEHLNLPVHIHSSVGIGDYFSLQRGSVMNLEPVLRDPRYDHVSFVLLHAGFPEDEKAIWMAVRKNVYLDTSALSEMLYPEQFKNHLKVWLTTLPEKVIFGSDAFPFNEALGAEEAFWVATETARTALAAALAELVSEGVFTQERALQVARGYLHENAAKLYGSMATPVGR